MLSVRCKLPKSSKLCSLTAIERLFDRDAAAGTVAYPLRAVWRADSARQAGDAMQFMITIPKKKLRHAVDRVTMRRRVREAYRLARRPHLEAMAPEARLDIAFIYLADTLLPYRDIERAVRRILDRAVPLKTAEP